MPAEPAGAAILAIDQGTTSSRAIAFDLGGNVVVSAQQPLPQHFPRDGWVEQDPEDIWRTVLDTARQAAAEARAKGFALAAVGIVNQRETTVVWDRGTGRAIHNAIVWQDRRGADRCRKLVADGAAPAIRRTTGLVPDSYFSATKLEWLFGHVDGAGAAARDGTLAFGTIDSFLLWHLTGGAVHATDATNASRTMLFDIEAQAWDDALCREFGVPAAVLPEVRDSAGALRHGRPGNVRRAGPGYRHCRRPAGGAGRAGLPGAGHGQEHLRHRLLHPGQRRTGAARTRRGHPGDRRLAARRRDGLCRRGRHFQRRHRGPVVARRAGRHRGQCGDRRTGGRPAGQRRRLSRARLHRPRRALVGRRGARRPVRPDKGYRRRTSGARGARSLRLSDRQPAGSHGRATIRLGSGSASAQVGCASTAAWRPTTG